MSTQVISILLQGRNETQAAFQGVQQAAKLTTEQIVALANAGKDERGKLLDDFQKMAAAATGGAAATEKWTEANQRAAMAMAAAHDQASKLNEGLSETKGHADEISHAFANALGLGAFLTVAGGAAAVLSSVRDVVHESIVGTAEYAHNLENLSLKTGISTTGLQELGLAARLGGKDVEGLARAVTLMEANVAQGSPKAVKAMQALHLDKSVFDDTETAIRTISERLQEIGDVGERANIARALLGKGGLDMLPALMQDLDAVSAKARELGVVMNEDDVRAASDLAVSAQLLSETWNGLLQQFGLTVARSEPVNEALKKLTDDFAEVSKATAKGGGSSSAADSIGEAATAALQFGEDLNATKGPVLTWIENLYKMNPILLMVKESTLALSLAQKAFHEAVAMGSPLGDLPTARPASGTSDKAAAMEMLGLPADLDTLTKGLADDLKKAKDQILKDDRAFQAEKDKIAKLLYDSSLRAMNDMRKAVEQDHKNQMAEGLRFLTEEAKHDADEQKLIDDNTRQFIAEVKQKAEERKKADAAELKEMQEHARESEAAIKSIGSSIGGVFGDIFGSFSKLIAQSSQDVTDNVANSFEKSLMGVLDNPKVREALNGIAGAVQVAMQGYSIGHSAGSAGTGALEGAASGAAMGAAIGAPTGIGAPVGAVIGGVIGGVAGWIGGNKAEAEQKAQMEEMRQQLLQTYGSMEALQKLANALGVDISKAFTTRDPQQFQAIVSSLNQGLADQQKRMQGVSTAMQGLDLMTKGFMATMDAQGTKSGLAWDVVSEKLANYEAKLKALGLTDDEISQRMHQRENQLSAGIKGATDEQQAAFKRLGDYAAATFGAMVKETGDVIGALQQMEPTLSNLADLEGEFGLKGSSALQELLGLRQIVTDNADIAQSIQGLNLLMKGLGDAGIHSTSIFTEFGQDLAADFKNLTDKGVDATQALILMQPALQQLWEHQQKFHDITDEATLALLHQGETAGLVGEDQKSIYDKIFDVLKDIDGVLRGLPTDVNTNINVNTHYTQTGDPPPGGGNGQGGKFGWNDDGSPNNDGDPSTPYAFGGYAPYVPGGHPAIVGERVGETVLPDDYIGRLASKIVAAGGAGGSGGSETHIHVHLDGQELRTWIVRQQKAGFLN